MTTTIENEFGSKIFVRGFLLNNEMTDFSSAFKDPEGRLVANRIEPGKRPRSAMAPMIVCATASPHGGRLAGRQRHHQLRGQDAGGRAGWGLDIQAAISLPNMGSRNKDTELEKGTALEAWRPRWKRWDIRCASPSFPAASTAS